MTNDEQSAARRLAERGYATTQQVERFLRSREAAKRALERRQTVQ